MVAQPLSNQNLGIKVFLGSFASPVMSVCYLPPLSGRPNVQFNLRLPPNPTQSAKQVVFRYSEFRITPSFSLWPVSNADVSYLKHPLRFFLHAGFVRPLPLMSKCSQQILPFKACIFPIFDCLPLNRTILQVGHEIPKSRQFSWVLLIAILFAISYFPARVNYASFN